MDDSLRTHDTIDMQDAHLPCMFYPVLSQSLRRNGIEPWMTVTLISLNRVCRDYNVSIFKIWAFPDDYLFYSQECVSEIGLTCHTDCLKSVYIVLNQTIYQ